ncbi:uncharacterized protein [Scyliorhinus torazame]|uniref:uncharacterized protein isoform X2 n=1 Tax=Scyliorhinus torazame TaxID=75743 RepID=UPI003B5B6A22
MDREESMYSKTSLVIATRAAKFRTDCDIGTGRGQLTSRASLPFAWQQVEEALGANQQLENGLCAQGPVQYVEKMPNQNLKRLCAPSAPAYI